jgi:hypothetical protein
MTSSGHARLCVALIGATMAVALLGRLHDLRMREIGGMH